MAFVGKQEPEETVRPIAARIEPDRPPEERFGDIDVSFRAERIGQDTQDGSGGLVISERCDEPLDALGSAEADGFPQEDTPARRFDLLRNVRQILERPP